MTKRRIIGIGNLLRGDDAAGRLVARSLAESPPEGSEVVELSGDALDLVEAWRGVEEAIVIDAVSSGAPPGTVHFFDVKSGPLPAALSGCSTHGFGLSEAIGLAEAFGTLPERLVVYGIEGRDFAIGRGGISPEVERAVALTVRRIGDLRERTNDA